MISEMPNIEILAKFEDIAPHLPSLIEAADEDRDALGFFPQRVYHEYARGGRLFVATCNVDGESRYAGHVLFDARHPIARVRQVSVSSQWRRAGIAATLLNELKSHLEEHSFTSIYARVAEDLRGAYAFWESQAFYVQRTEPGGKTKNRTILVLAHELDTPQLFRSSGISGDNILGLLSASSSEIPLYLLDLNVLFDIGPRRKRREGVISVFRAERIGACRLAISSEISKELTRTANDRKTDPMLEFANIFPEF